jgi:hypothetical protein
MTFFLSQFIPSCQSLTERYSFKNQYLEVIMGEITQPGMKFELAMVRVLFLAAPQADKFLIYADRRLL